MNLDRIRNFCIVAHIDHGKSTLADRLIEATGMLQKREMKAQVLDTLDLERERGITIKLNAVRMTYTAQDGKSYELNLIDTPGHVDFTYEVSRSLAACEGAILVVDASQGIQAQTLSNLFLALDAGLEIIPVLNKIDLPGAEPERRKQEVHDLLGVDPDDILLVSAKEGHRHSGAARGSHSQGAAATRETRRSAARADLRFVLRPVSRRHSERARRRRRDSRRHEDHVRRERIRLRGRRGRIQSAAPGEDRRARAGRSRLRRRQRALGEGDARRRHDLRRDEPAHRSRCPATSDVRSFVFAGIYPTDTQQYETLRDALEKLQLNDASLHYEPETSTALGFGFRCGFLGLLHMEIVQERLEREFDLDLVTTVPSVEYHVYRTDGTMQLIENPSKMPPPASSITSRSRT